MNPTMKLRWKMFVMDGGKCNPSAHYIPGSNTAFVLQQWWAIERHGQITPIGEWRDVPVEEECQEQNQRQPVLTADALSAEWKKLGQLQNVSIESGSAHSADGELLHTKSSQKINLFLTKSDGTSNDLSTMDMRYLWNEAW